MGWKSRLIIGFVAGFVTSAGIALVTAPRADAIYMSPMYRWHPSVVARAQAYGTSFPNEVASAVANYDAFTHLNLPAPCWEFACGKIEYTQTSYGDTPWGAGLAQPWAWTPSTGWINCVEFWSGNNTGWCDTSSKQVQYAYIFYNTTFWSTLAAYPQNVARHELGHVFGLAHFRGSTNSVMNISESHLHQVLQNYDRTDINSLYPP